LKGEKKGADCILMLFYGSSFNTLNIELLLIQRLFPATVNPVELKNMKMIYMSVAKMFGNNCFIKI